MGTVSTTPEQLSAIGAHAARDYVSEPTVRLIGWAHDRVVARLTFPDGGERFVSAGRYGDVRDHDQARSDGGYGYVSDADALAWIEGAAFAVAVEFESGPPITSYRLRCGHVARVPGPCGATSGRAWCDTCGESAAVEHEVPAGVTS